jgi:hypothetical protein
MSRLIRNVPFTLGLLLSWGVRRSGALRRRFVRRAQGAAEAVWEKEMTGRSRLLQGRKAPFRWTMSCRKIRPTNRIGGSGFQLLRFLYTTFGIVLA